MAYAVWQTIVAKAHYGKEKGGGGTIFEPKITGDAAAMGRRRKQNGCDLERQAGGP